MINQSRVYVDSVHGQHWDGVGWNPLGVFCGECSFATCKGCVNEFIKKIIDEDD